MNNDTTDDVLENFHNEENNFMIEDFHNEGNNFMIEDSHNEENHFMIEELLESLPKVLTPEYATLTILDKITSRDIKMRFKIGETKSLGKLSITVEKCIINKDRNQDSHFTLIKVLDTNTEKKQIFYGWLISSSPSISTLEHPVYEILENQCKYN